MKKYKLIVTMIIAVGVILIGTSNPISNIYKSTNFISKFKLDNDNKDNNTNYQVSSTNKFTEGGNNVTGITSTQNQLGR